MKWSFLVKSKCDQMQLARILNGLYYRFYHAPTVMSTSSLIKTTPFSLHNIQRLILITYLLNYWHFYIFIWYKNANLACASTVRHWWNVWELNNIKGKVLLSLQCPFPGIFEQSGILVFNAYDRRENLGNVNNRSLVS